jgi:hypothetical protein
MIKKILATILIGSTLSGCATIFYESPPTFQQAPLACGLDVLFGFAVAPTAVDMIYGACRIEGLKK